MPNIHQENHVIVRVWTSGKNGVRPGENVGHISLETKQGYMSLWPTGEGKLQGVGFFKPIAHEFKPDYAFDLEAEERKPEYTIVLYSLNCSNIQEKFQTIANTIDGWALVGGVLLLNGNSAESCASMAYKLLDAGGIYHLVSSLRSCTLSSSASPDELARLVVDAK